MRGPRKSWQYADEAIEALLRALETVARGAPAEERVDKLLDAQIKAKRLSEFIWEHEECEKP